VGSPTYRPNPALSGALRFAAYGDILFTATTETEASSARRARHLWRRWQPVALFTLE
jgi:hypothetical protein